MYIVLQAHDNIPNGLFWVSKGDYVYMAAFDAVSDVVILFNGAIGTKDRPFYAAKIEAFQKDDFDPDESKKSFLCYGKVDEKGDLLTFLTAVDVTQYNNDDSMLTFQDEIEAQTFAAKFNLNDQYRLFRITEARASQQVCDISHSIISL